MTTITIPTSKAELVERFASVDRLIRAKEWEKAAIVAAFVRLDPGGGGRNSRKPAAPGGFMSATEFAELGINSLRSKATVTIYVQRWLDAHDGVYPEPGAKVVLPDEEWAGTRTGTDGYDSPAGAERTIAKLIEKHGPGVVTTAVLASSEVVDAIVSNPLVKEIVLDQEFEEATTTERDRSANERGRRQESQDEILVRIGTRLLASHSQRVYEAMLRHQHDVRMSEGRINATRSDLDAVIQHAINARALVTPVTDEDLANFMAGQKGAT